MTSTATDERNPRLALAKLRGTIDVLADGVTRNIAESPAVKRVGGIDKGRLHERVVDLLNDETRTTRQRLGEATAATVGSDGLRAAAPALLESLKDAIAPFAGDQSPPRWVGVARAVIAKVEV